MDTYGLFLKSMLNNRLQFNCGICPKKRFDNRRYGLEQKICWQIK